MAVGPLPGVLDREAELARSGVAPVQDEPGVGVGALSREERVGAMVGYSGAAAACYVLSPRGGLCQASTDTAARNARRRSRSALIRRGSGTGTAASRAFVYGWLGAV